ncbi:hypothetical protein [Bifidobacterium cuniculi]|uniref:hypothetical protein n=1 Tax=Bifidobacterium cuniculi TaxID=1688 RepID=UPI000529E688|nr:hypothetical protein [Bifidobacterium cuniculi]
MMKETPPIDVNVVVDDLCAQIARLTKENAVLRAQLTAVKAQREVVAHGQGDESGNESETD